MPQSDLVGEDRDGGVVLLEATDAAGVPVDAAFWIYDPPTDRWRLHIHAGQGVSGPRDFASRIIDAINVVPDLERRENARRVVLERSRPSTSTDPVVDFMREVVTGRGVRFPPQARAPRRLRNLSLRGNVVEDAVVYRL